MLDDCPVHSTQVTPPTIVSVAHHLNGCKTMEMVNYVAQLADAQGLSCQNRGVPTASTKAVGAPRETRGLSMQVYRLWAQARSWCDYEIPIETAHLPAIRSLFPPEWPGGNQELSPDVELIPEPEGPRGPWAISIRTAGRTLGYLDAEVAPRWAGVVRRVVASGFIPTTDSRIGAYEYDGWDGLEFRAWIRIALGKPDDALPLNTPPSVPEPPRV